MRLLKRAALVLAASLALSGALSGGAQAAQPASERQTPSGMPVPRYVSLKFGQVNARAGPGDDHKLLFVYKVRGLPLQVVAETSEWRRVCDPEGTLAWVHKRVTDGRRMTMNTAAQAVPLLKRPKDGFSAAAFLNPHALAALDRCDKGWCKVKADRASGWVREGALWGTADTPQCRASAP
ncbi:SH3 domain-containing protein [Phenylobacterium sp.]|uniref:SH3 domain-containing protein n=1 Tax=Phenylobacterium sp. TaxID=1871053 RepID=UPI0025D4FC41|nr:SH3 domain-containing protein [Phenylobacterium sp.]